MKKRFKDYPGALIAIPSSIPQKPIIRSQANHRDPRRVGLHSFWASWRLGDTSLTDWTALDPTLALEVRVWHEARRQAEYSPRGDMYSATIYRPIAAELVSEQARSSERS